VLGEGGAERMVPVVVVGSATIPRAGNAEATDTEAWREALVEVEVEAEAEAAEATIFQILALHCKSMKKSEKV
jgi:hypothetical protein